MSGHNNYCKIRDEGGAYFPEKSLLVFGTSYAALMKEARASPTTILVEDSPDYTSALADIRNGTFAPKTIAVFDRSANDAVLPRLDKNIDKVHLLFNVPENVAEAEQIHSNLPKETINGYMSTFKSVAEQYKHLGGVKIIPTSTLNAGQFVASYISSLSNSDFVIISSHIKSVADYREIDELVYPFQLRRLDYRLLREDVPSIAADRPYKRLVAALNY